MAISCQRRTFFSARSPESRTFERAETAGMMRFTPNSVPFCTAKSIFSEAETA